MNRTYFSINKFLTYSPHLFLRIVISARGCNRDIPATETGNADCQQSHPQIRLRRLSPTAALGLAENPLILALPPSANSQGADRRRQSDASQITERTGYTVVTIIPDSETALVEALGNGNAHIVLLEPYAYELAYQRGWVHAAYAVLRMGKANTAHNSSQRAKAASNPISMRGRELNISGCKNRACTIQR